MADGPKQHFGIRRPTGGIADFAGIMVRWRAFPLPHEIEA